MKKGLLTLLPLLSIPFVSAYFGSPFYFQNINLDINSLALVGVFLLAFAASMFAMNRSLSSSQQRTGRIILSMVIGLFATYWVWKWNIDFAFFFTSYGLDKMMSTIGPYFFIIILAIFMIKWNFSSVVLAFSGISFLIAMLSLSPNSNLNTTAFLVLGVVLFIIGTSIKQRGRFGKTLKKIKEDEKETEKEIEIEDKEIKEEKRKPAQFQNRSSLLRKIGIRNLSAQILRLEKELEENDKRLQKGFEIAGERFKKEAKIKKSERKKWTESPEGREEYKKWYRQIKENEVLKRRAKDLENQISELKKKIKNLQSKI